MTSTQLTRIEQIISSESFVNNFRRLFFSWTVMTIIILFVIRINGSRADAADNFFYQTAYPTIGAMIILIILYRSGLSRYSIISFEFKYYVRNQLKGTDLEDRTPHILSLLVPTLKVHFLRQYILFILTVLTFYSVFILLTMSIRWIVLLIGIIVIVYWYKRLLLINEESILRSSTALELT